MIAQRFAELEAALLELHRGGMHEGECTFEGECPTCGIMLGHCAKHAESYRQRQINADNALNALRTEVAKCQS